MGFVDKFKINLIQVTILLILGNAKLATTLSADPVATDTTISDPAIAAACSKYDGDAQRSAICINVLNDERTHIQNFNTSIYAPIVTGLSSALSVLANIAILIYLKRSTVGLSTVYHRIMLGMSAGDLLASLGMMVTTLPMPSDTIYDFSGATVGNDISCTVQGFAVWYGTATAFLYTGALSFYYLLFIKFKMKDDLIKRCIEPIFIHFSIFVISIVGPIFTTVNRRYNPTPLEPWCTPVSYPWHCPLEEGCTLRGSTTPTARSMRWYLTYHYTFMYFFNFLTISVSMALIVSSINQQERYIEEYIAQNYTRRERVGSNTRQLASSSASAAVSSALASTQQRHSYTKLMQKIAVAYIASAVFTQGTVLFHINDTDVGSYTNMNMNTDTGTDTGTGTGTNTLETTAATGRWVLQAAHAFLAPLQGFFNAVIFFAMKIIDVRRATPTLTIKEAAWRVMTVPEHKLFVISSMSIVARDSSDHAHAHHRRREQEGEEWEGEEWEEKKEDEEREKDHHNVLSFDGDDDEQIDSFQEDGMISYPSAPPSHPRSIKEDSAVKSNGNGGDGGDPTTSKSHTSNSNDNSFSNSSRGEQGERRQQQQEQQQQEVESLSWFSRAGSLFSSRGVSYGASSHAVSSAGVGEYKSDNVLDGNGNNGNNGYKNGQQNNYGYDFKTRSRLP